jgi:hypothetical protein
LLISTSRTFLAIMIAIMTLLYHLDPF